MIQVAHLKRDYADIIPQCYR